MTYKQIEAMREARLWLGQIVIPVASTAIMALSIPQVREAVAAKAYEIRYKLKKH